MANFTPGSKAQNYAKSYQYIMQCGLVLLFKRCCLRSWQSSLLVACLLVASCQPSEYPGNLANEMVIQAVIRSGHTPCFDNIPVPSPALSPSDVVKIQLVAFKYNDEDNYGISVAFNFFEPESRKKDRTLEQFVRWLSQPSYSALLNFEMEKPGPLTLEGNKASQQILLIGADGVTSRYTFQLAKQKRGKNVGCWLVTAIQVDQASTSTTHFVSYTKQQEHLDSLFALMKVTRSPIELKLLESLVSEIWMESGTLSVNKLMKVGCDALEREDYENAIKVFDQVILKMPQFAEGWNKRATAHYLNGDFEQSLADIKQTLLLEKRHFGALSGQISIYILLGDDMAALRGLEMLMAVYPTQPGLKERINELYGRLGISRI